MKLLILEFIDPVSKLLGNWSQEINIYSILLRLLISILFGAIIGCERSNKRHAAGLRTFILASFSCTMAMILDVFISMNGAKFYIVSLATMLAVAIISTYTTIYTSRSKIRGLTTSVGLCGCGVVGLTIGAGFYTISLIGFACLLIILSAFPHFEIYLKNRSNHFEIHLELKNASFLKDFVTTIRELGLKVDDIEANPAYHNSGLSGYSVSLSIVSNELKKYKTHSEIIEAIGTLDYVYHVEEI